MIKDNYTHKSIVLSKIGSILPIVAFILSVTTGPFILTRLDVFDPIYLFLIFSSVISFLSSSISIVFYFKSKPKKKKSLVSGIIGIILSIILILFAFWMNIIFGYKWH